MRSDLLDIVAQSFVRQMVKAPYLHCSTGIIAHIHCLPSVPVTLISWLIQLGFKAQNIIIIPKSYSTVPGVIKELLGMGVTVIREPEPSRYVDYGHLSADALAIGFSVSIAKLKDARRVVLLDDGGLLTDAWSKHYRGNLHNVVSVQQTSSGLNRKELQRWCVPYIDVARCAAKTMFESPIIARGIIAKMKTLPEYNASSTVGVVGVGAVGSRVAMAFQADKRQVWSFDKRIPPVRLRGIRHAAILGEFFRRSNLIVGCTGRNWIFPGRLSRLLKHSHTLVSCSSRSVEFQTVLNQPYTVTDNGLFGTHRTLSSAGKQQTILNGGFPINFDRETEWETENEIILTRSLVLAGILTATYVNATAAETVGIRLSTECQSRLVDRWLRGVAISAKTFGVDPHDIQHLEWWAENSAGTDPELDTV